MSVFQITSIKRQGFWLRWSNSCFPWTLYQ